MRLLSLLVATTAVPALLTAQENVVMVYSSRSHYGSEPVFEAFTKATGIEVKFFNGNNNEVLERLKAEGAQSPADVFLAVDAGNLWLATQAGLLQPVQSAELARNIPAHLREPQGQWYAIAMRARTIVYSTERVKPAELSTYEALGDAKWKGRLCLRTSSAVYNQSLLASFIAIHGEAGAERIVKRWVANEPRLFTGDTQLLEAIAAGQCDVGITNHYYLARLLAQKPDVPVAVFWADQQGTGTHVNVSGAGVVKNAKHRANAIKLLEYLSRPESQVVLAAGSFEFPANPAASVQEILQKFGTFKPQKVGAAAAGQYQAAAVKLADRAGYR
ncbi:MAG: extracellular solute-binding protein [Longimicrobiales bacterium]